MEEFTNDQKVKYRLYDEKGKAHWFTGAIHGIRRYEDPATNAIIKQTYLIDTGRNERVDKIPFNKRDRAINEHVARFMKAGKKQEEALFIAQKQPDLPDSSIEFETVRQPEQIELEAKDLRSV